MCFCIFVVNSAKCAMTGQKMCIIVTYFCSIIRFYSSIDKKYKFFSVIFFTNQKLAISLHRESRVLREPTPCGVWIREGECGIWIREGEYGEA